MPLDELAELGADLVVRAVGTVPELIFNRHVARYFHGIGRRVISILTLGQTRIPSSLRDVTEGTKPEPTIGDWISLVAGIAVFATTLFGVMFVSFSGW
jgi:hypothetical protein